MNAAGDGEDDIGGDGPKKSERKRERERQRRFDLANAFDELATLLSEVEPDEPDANSLLNHRRRRRRSGTDSSTVDADHAESSGMTRLDLIGRSIEAMRRLNRENKELKRIVEQQREGRDEKEVFVMVPTLTSIDQDHSGHVVGARASYPSPYYPQAQHGQSQHMGQYPHDYRGAPGASYYSGPMHAAYSYGGNWGGGGPPPLMQQQQPSPQPGSPYPGLPQNQPSPPDYDQGARRTSPPKSPGKPPPS